MLSEANKIRTNHPNLFLRVVKGHFATSHSHINYYIDVTTQKTRLSEAQAVAHALATHYKTSIVDTILCLDGTEVIGTCLARELTEGDFYNMNSHQTIYVATPEHTSGSQIVFRDNTAPMIYGKHVLILAASVTTGYTAKSSIEAINYYGGHVVGVASIFASLDSCMGYPVKAVFDTADLIDYSGYAPHECPMCKNGKRIEALVNSFGYSKLSGM